MFDLHKYLDKKFDLIYMNPPFNISNLINKKVRLLDIHFIDYCLEKFLNNKGYLIAICSASVLDGNNKYKWFWDKWKYILIDKILGKNFKNDISGNVMNIYIGICVLLFRKYELLLIDQL